MDFDIIHLVRIYRPNIGGMETIVEQIANEQINYGLKVAVITTNYHRDTVSKNYFDNVFVKRLNFKNLNGYLIPMEIPKNIKTNILHIHGMDIFVDFTSVFISYKKKILSPHGGFFHTKKLSLIKSIYFNTISKLLYSKLNSYAISFNDVTLTKKINCNSFYMGCGFNNRNIITTNGKDIIIFGRIGSNKRVDLSIKFALNKFNDSTINVVGFDEIGLMKNYSKNNKIKYFGVVDDNEFNNIILSSKYFIFLSEYEGLGMSFIEALDMGLKCVVSNIESFKLLYDQIKDENKFKFVFFYDEKNFDQIQFSNWIEMEPTNDEKITLRNTVRSFFNWKNVVKILNYEL